MPKFTILLMPFVLVGVLEMLDWSPPEARTSREQIVSRKGCRCLVRDLPPATAQPEAAQEIAPRRESLEQPQ